MCESSCTLHYTDLEPKLRKAVLRMRKLDRVLQKRVIREKEVKRDRIMLQKRY